MSFRIEQKIPINPSQSAVILEDLFSKGLKELYKKRKIESIYFDTFDKRLFNESEEGSSPSKKIRFRKYPEQEEPSYNIEVKVSSLEGRYKTSRPISSLEFDDYYNNGFIDNDYGMTFPICKVAYEREYFIINNIRLTLDTSILYTSLDAISLEAKEPQRVIEIKADYETNIDLLNKLLPMPRHRFSKYCNAIKYLSINV